MSDPFHLLAPFIQEYIRRERWNELRPVQLAAIPAILESDAHVLLCSGTASGKTEAAFLPVITSMIESPPDSIGALYVSPLKALINDQFQRLDALLEDSDIPLQAWHGDVAPGAKQRFLRQGRGILQITPESLESLLLRRHLELPRLFHDLRFVVLDEVHALINSDRGRQVLCQLQRLEQFQSRPPRRIGLSATIGEPKRVGEWLAGNTGKKVCIPGESLGRRRVQLGLEHFILPLTDDEESADESQTWESQTFHDHMAKLVANWPKTLVFVNTRAMAEEIVHNLKQRRPDAGNVVTHAHHGNVAAALREDAEADMRDATRHSCVVATVTLELGIDVGALDQVLQVNSTSSVSSLIQRLGRSGRRDNPPRMFLYSTENEAPANAHPAQRLPWGLLQAIAIVQLYHEERWVEPPQSPALPASLLVQQTLSTLAGAGGLKPRELARQMLSLAPFAGFSLDQFRALLLHMLEQDLLQRSVFGELLIGLKGERIVNDWRFYATFESPQEFIVRAGARDVGSLHDAPPVGVVFRLAGRAWEVLEQDLERRIVFVRRARGRTPPRWEGEGPPLHRRIAQRLRQVLAEDTQYAWLQPRARQRLASARQLARASDFHYQMLHEMGKRSCLLLPWSGTREVSTLELLLRRVGLNCNLIARPYALRINGVDQADLRERIAQLLQDMPDAAALAADVATFDLPRGKFDRHVPEGLLRAAWASDVLDVQGAREILENCLAAQQGNRD